MSYEDFTHTESELPAAKVPRTGALPWILLFVTVAVFIGTTLFLWYRASEETRRATQSYVEKTKAEAERDQARALVEGQKRDLAVQTAEVEQLKSDKARLESELKAALAKAEKSAKTAKKAPAKRKKKRR